MTSVVAGVKRGSVHSTMLAVPNVGNGSKADISVALSELGDQVGVAHPGRHPADLSGAHLKHASWRTLPRLIANP